MHFWIFKQNDCGSCQTKVSSSSWYSIKRPRRDARLSWPRLDCKQLCSVAASCIRVVSWTWNGSIVIMQSGGEIVVASSPSDDRYPVDWHISAAQSSKATVISHAVKQQRMPSAVTCCTLSVLLMTSDHLTAFSCSLYRVVDVCKGDVR